eukprot:2839494-Rhodomonas_salina.2
MYCCSRGAVGSSAQHASANTRIQILWCKLPPVWTSPVVEHENVAAPRTALRVGALASGAVNRKRNTRKENIALPPLSDPRAGRRGLEAREKNGIVLSKKLLVHAVSSAVRLRVAPPPEDRAALPSLAAAALARLGLGRAVVDDDELAGHVQRH